MIMICWNSPLFLQIEQGEHPGLVAAAWVGESLLNPTPDRTSRRRISIAGHRPGVAPLFSETATA